MKKKMMINFDSLLDDTEGMNEKDAVNFICKSLEKDYSYEDISRLCDSYIRKMQTGLGMAQSLPTNSVFRGRVTNLYQ